MAPTSVQQVLLSPAELSYLHTSLAATPPIRPDARTATQFRPLVAETDILPGTNGSARICFADGTEAIVGVKAEVEKTPGFTAAQNELAPTTADDPADAQTVYEKLRSGNDAWLDLTVEIPGFRDDDTVPVFLSSILSEALLADGELTKKLWINRRFHWKLYIDILLLSPPLSYPLPLLSLTTHLALLATRIPKLKSELDEDPLFDDDWEASVYLYGRAGHTYHLRPPLTLLVMSVQDNIIFDPTKEELAVAEVVLAVSVGERNRHATGSADVGSTRGNLRLLAARTIDPPSRLTQPGVPNFLNTTTGAVLPEAGQSAAQRENLETDNVWQAPRGGALRKTISAMISQVLNRGGVADEVLSALETVELG